MYGLIGEKIIGFQQICFPIYASLLMNLVGFLCFTVPLATSSLFSLKGYVEASISAGIL